MMSLDSITLYLVATMVAALLGAMMVFFGRQEDSPALKWWGTAYLLGAASVALWTAAGDRLGPQLYLALTAVGFVACGMVWNAARVFHGRKPNWPGLVLGALAWVATVTLLDPAASMLRRIAGAGIVSVYAALTASEHGRSAANSSPPMRPDRSVMRRLLTTTVENSFSISSPAGWPKRSLIDLK